MSSSYTSQSEPSASRSRLRPITAVLGPTNTGKTHLAIERMLGHETGMIGLPLRLLAREVYDRVVAKVGASQVALITGEEKIKPDEPRYYVCTVEAMPLDISVDFLAIDEIQLAADPDRGHVFTNRLQKARGMSETLVLGASTMRDVIREVCPGANFITRRRLSKLTYCGHKKVSRLPRRSAVVAFSASDVYAIAELIRRQRGGAAVVLGALSPRTRNAQVALYQSGDVDFLVATDAIGMGLNLDVDHVAFAAVRKFDGQRHRELTPVELGQVAGRAGRHMNDGTFGATADVPPFDSELVQRLEGHEFDPVKLLQWRNDRLDFANVEALKASLAEAPRIPQFCRSRMADDALALETVSRFDGVRERASGEKAVALLWDVCQTPDYRKISPTQHGELVGELFEFLAGEDGHIPEDWFASQVALADRTDGDIDTLANRISHIRTWTYVANRADWLKDPAHWQGRTRQIEDSLSDALHDCLLQRFVDRRTSALMRRLRDEEELFAEISENGKLMVEKHYVGRLEGFRFTPDEHSEGIDGKAARHAAAQVLSKELSMRARRVAAAKDDAFALTQQGHIAWKGEDIARISAGDEPLKPVISLIADDQLSPVDREKVQARVNRWLAEQIQERLRPLVQLETAEDVTGLARGVAFRLREGLGVLKRDDVAREIRDLDQQARSQLRRYGVRFGAFNIFFPLLLKPAATEMLFRLWELHERRKSGQDGDAIGVPPRPGLTSVAADPNLSHAYYRACGFHVCGPRAVRIDILERLSDMIRPLIAWRAKDDAAGAGGEKRPDGASGDGGFTVTADMMSILGCSASELGEVLKSLGFFLDRRKMTAEEIAEVRSRAQSMPPKEEGGEESAGAAQAREETAAPDPSLVDGEPTRQADAPSADAPSGDGPGGDGPGGDGPGGDDASKAEASPEAPAPEAPKLEAAPEVEAGQERRASLDVPRSDRSGDAAHTASAEAGNGQAAIEAIEANGAADGAADEDLYIEIWRPRRRRMPETNRDSRKARGQAGRQQRQSSGQGEATHASRGRRSSHTEAGSEKTTESRSPGRSGTRGGRYQTQSGRPPERGPHKGKGQVRSAGPKKEVDKDSPFAALMALKKQMEEKSGDGQSGDKV